VARKASNPDPCALENAPRSLLAGANRIHFDRFVELLINTRSDCDATAAELGLTSKDDGLAVLKFLAGAILEVVRREKAEQKATSQPPRRKSGQHESTRRLKEDWKPIYDREKEFLRATPATLTKWIAAIDENLRLGTTDSGETISPQLEEQIRAYRDRLDQRRTALKSGKIKRPSLREVRDKLAEQFVKTGFYGKPRRGQDARTYIDEKYKRARSGIRKWK
jgi:hypothetical protein